MARLEQVPSWVQMEKSVRDFLFKTRNLVVRFMKNTNDDGRFAGENLVMVTDSNGVPTTLSNVSASSLTNFMPINQNGIVSANTAWDDLRFEMARVGAVKNEPTLAWHSINTATNILSRAFTDEAVAGNEKEVVFVGQMPHGYARDRGETSNIRLHIHYTFANNVSNQNAVFGLEVSWANIGGVFPGNSFHYSNVPVWTYWPMGRHCYQTIAANIDGTNKTESSVICCRLFRNSSNTSDNYTNTIYVMTTDFHIQLEKAGSRNEVPGV